MAATIFPIAADHHSKCAGRRECSQRPALGPARRRPARRDDRGRSPRAAGREWSMAVVSLEVAGGPAARRGARLEALGQAALRVQEALTPDAVLAEMGAELSGLGFGWQHSRLVEDGA